MSDRSTIVKELISLTIQKTQLQKIIDEADAFTSKGLLNIDVTIPFKNGPYAGQTWADVYRGMVKNKISIKSIDNQIQDLQFDLECLNLIDKSLVCVLTTSDGKCKTCLSLDEVKAFRKMLNENEVLLLDKQASNNTEHVDVDLDL